MIVRVQVVLQEWWCKDWIEIARSQIQQLQKVLPGYQHQESATAVQYYFMFQQKGKNLSKASSLTLDVLLNDEHKFMTKMRKDNDNSLHPLKFDKNIHSFGGQIRPIFGLDQSIHFQEFIIWKYGTISRLQHVLSRWKLSYTQILVTN